MVILIAGGSHTGKTLLAQRLLERYHYPYLSIDHLKMGLIRSGHVFLDCYYAASLLSRRHGCAGMGEKKRLGPYFECLLHPLGRTSRPF